MISIAALLLATLAGGASCNLDAAANVAINESGAVFFSATAKHLSSDAAEVLKDDDPRLPCSQRQERIKEVVDLWIRDGSVSLDRRNQQVLPVLRKFGEVKIVAPSDVKKIRVVYRDEEKTVLNGSIVYVDLGMAKIVLYDKDKLLCEVSLAVRAEHEEIARCPKLDPAVRKT